MRALRAPICFVYGNCVFGAALDDCWVAFRVDTASYQWLSDDGKRARFLELLGAVESIEADMQILRIARSWDVERYLSDLASVEHVDARGLHRARANDLYLLEHARRLGDIGNARAAVYLIVSLRDPERDVASYVSQAAESDPKTWLRAVRRALSPRSRSTLAASELERVRIRADQVHARLADFLPVRPARGVELQWLIRRAFCRGLGEPDVDGLHEPRALTFESERRGGAGAAGGGRLALDGRIRRARTQVSANRV